MTGRLARPTPFLAAAALAASVALAAATPATAKMTTGVTCNPYPGLTTVTWNARDHLASINLAWFHTSTGAPVVTGPV